MIKAQIYDVFCNKTAKGNPCSVVELDEWASDELLLQITHKQNQPVTSFIVQSGDSFYIRWFTLDGEINLCGHGSLGAGAALISKYQVREITLNSQYGQVVVSEKNGSYKIIMPMWLPKNCSLPLDISGLISPPIETFSTRDLVLVLDSEDEVINFKPDFSQLEKITDFHALIITAKRSEDSYVLRYFAPKIGIFEDLATGSAQCSLAPYWFQQLGTGTLSVSQLSSTGGYFEVEKGVDSTIVLSAQVKIRKP
ncbi:PhzF family phenazine biosynthesis protein [Vibrio cortegadensis]|uniref:PhzF family phenazine biosynthesis protein n=1 Tax=Vibrio cortegadensis TaxID=1328770 RepID=UPI0021C2F284|nr:PhzF family phenazine biosynthesis protein [Vibrio cortegadensis]MDN3697564.1 PhzF family phenazine biosynthesis protein [Vibrio cortegadensis]